MTGARAGYRRGTGSARSATALIAVTSTVANLLSYLFNLLMTRSLGVQGYGELASLLAIVVTASVPGVALQAAIARRITNGRTPNGLIAVTLWLSVGVSGLVLALEPALVALLHLSGFAVVGWTAGYLLPTTISYAWQGILQGRQRFWGLGLMLVGTALAKLAGALLAVAWSATSSTALGGATVATAVLVVVVGPRVLRLAPGQVADRIGRELTRDIGAILGVLVLSSLDLLLARHYLPEQQSGIYAAGNLITRACFWGPAFLAMSSYPRFATPAERRAALRHSTGLLAGLAAAALLVTVAGAGLVPVLLGSGYRSLSHQAWLFAADGLALAAVQLGVYAAIAVHDHRIGRLVWLVALGEFVAVAGRFHHGTTQIITVALAGGLSLTAATLVLELRRNDQPPLTGAGQGPATSLGR
jgi:O-antigen/teichoic acid export membrane protein